MSERLSVKQTQTIAKKVDTMTDSISYSDYIKEVSDSAYTVIEQAIDELKYDGEEITEEAVHDVIFDHVLHDYVDGHQWIIYCHYNIQVLQHSSNAEYAADQFGGDFLAATVRQGGLSGLHTALAYWALYADIAEEIDSGLIVDILADKGIEE